jgi:hypothetical protein
MTNREEAELFRRVVEEIRSLVEPGSPADEDAECMARWVCELAKRGIVKAIPDVRADPTTQPDLPAGAAHPAE